MTLFYDTKCSFLFLILSTNERHLVILLHIQSYVNAIVSAFEDPEKILEQAVIDMNNDLTKMRQATAQV